MKSLVQLYLRVRLPDGTYPYLKAAYASNGRIRPHQAIKNGKAVSFPGSTYYLRYHTLVTTRITRLKTILKRAKLFKEGRPDSCY